MLECREIKEFAPHVEGLSFAAKIKQNMMILLQTRMEQKRIILPLDRVLLSQINEQQYRDQLWALALAVYAAKEKEPEPHLYAIYARS